MPIEGQQRVVLTPDLLGWALISEDAAPLFKHWREGTIQPVVNKAWILRCLRLFHRLGLSERLIRYWGWWLGSPPRCLIVAEPGQELGGEALCQYLARESSAAWIVYREGLDRRDGQEPSDLGDWEASHRIVLSKFLSLLDQGPNAVYGQ